MSKFEEKLAEARKRMEPTRQSFRFIWNTPPGREVLAALERNFFDLDTPKDANGRVDADAVLIQHGSNMVIEFIRQFVTDNDNEGQG